MNIKPVPAKAAKLSRLNAVGLDLVVEGLAADAEALGGFEFVAAGFLEHLNDGVALDAFQQGEAGIAAHVAGGGTDGKVRRLDHLALAEHDRALHLDLQLADVAGPVEGAQTLARF